MQQLLFGQAAFEVGAGVDAGRHMALDVQAVAAVVLALGMPEMVEAGTEHAGQRGEGADVAAQVAAVFRVVAVGLDHHRHRVPAHVGAQALLDLDVAGAAGFLLGRNGVDIGRVGRERQVDAAGTRLFKQLLDQEMGPVGAFLADDGLERVHPFARFLAIDILAGAAQGQLLAVRHGVSLVEKGGLNFDCFRFSHSFPDFSSNA